MNNREAFEVQRVLINLFERWKGYELPGLNSDNQFDKEWLHREWVAFQAGHKLAIASQAQRPAKISCKEFFEKHEYSDGRGFTSRMRNTNDANFILHATTAYDEYLQSQAQQPKSKPVMPVGFLDHGGIFYSYREKIKDGTELYVKSPAPEGEKP